jgi:hypothetical protein
MKQRILSILLSLFLAACSAEEPTAEAVAGTYVFVYPTGEAEVLLLDSDFTYRKDIYYSVDEYENNRRPKYSNTGTWSITPDKKLSFSEWLMYNDLADPSVILAKPITTHVNRVYWNKTRESCEISIYSETGYIFNRINQ